MGCDYLQGGFYTEVLFREKGVDSEKGESAEFAPFLNIMNEWYVRDTSRKITTVLRARGMTGNAHTSNHCPYGYKKDTLDSTHWVMMNPQPKLSAGYSACALQEKNHMT